MSELVRGVIHGRIVELESDPGLPDGETVELRILSHTNGHDPKRGWQHLEGILADDPEWDQIMAEIHEQRKVEQRPQLDDWDET